MRFNLVIILFFTLNACITTTATPLQFSVNYYSEGIDFEFDSETLPNDYIKFDEWFVKRTYNQLSKGSFDEIINKLKTSQEKYNLNGWLTYSLIKEIVDEVAPGKSTNYKRLLSWFLLNKMGYDARLAYHKNTYYIQVHTEDNLYEIPFFELDNRIFINITAVEGSKKKKQKNLEFYLIEYKPNPKGKSLSFNLSKFPKFTPKIVERTLRFWANGERQTLTVNLDKNIIQLMDDYPIVEERDYLERQLSPTLKNSLIPQLRQKISGLSQTESIQFILGLTRSGFSYKEDTEHFGYNRPMIADEVIYYAFSDCEDRSALFYNLIKELLDLPMIIVAYTDHLTIGVKLAINKGQPLFYKGESYTICDPTGPNNSSKLGIYPKGYERKTYEILGSHK